MNEFTPGPWKIDGLPITDAKGTEICWMGVPAQYAGDTPDVCPNDKANARLIAAAPELLAALQGLYENLRDMDDELTAGCPDDKSVGWNGDGSEMSMTFGHIRRAGTAIANATDIEKGADHD